MTDPFAQARVVAVSRDDTHRFSKNREERITLVAGIGVEGDTHAGTTVQHLSRVRQDPTTPNLRQVHLIHVDDAGRTVRLAGIMSVVLQGGVVRAGDPIQVALPVGPHESLGPV